MEQPKRVGIWIRVSTDDQARGESPEHHEKRGRLYAETKEWQVQEVYHLEALTGKSVMQYAETKRMLQDIKEKRISGLIFSKLARLARNTKELLEFADIFQDEGADLISLQESIDTSTPAGRLFYTMIAAMAQWEREEIVSRIAATVPIRAKLGKPMGGQASLGYKWENKQFIIDEKEAPIRRLIYELFLKYKRKRAVAKELNQRGYRTKNGSKFSDTTILRLLQDPTAKGERRANHRKSNLWGLTDAKNWIMVSCPAVVSPELWNECNRILNEQLTKRQRVGPRPQHLLAGYVTCTCGKKMYVFHKNMVYTCVKCKNRIPVETIDEIFHDQLKAFLLTETDLTTYMQNSDSTIKEKEKLLESAAKENGQLKKQMDELVKMRISGELVKESFLEHYKPLEERFLQLDQQLPILQAELDFLKIQYLSSDKVLQGARDLYGQWNGLPFEEKRTIVETITNKITIDKEDVTVSLSYMPTTNNLGNNIQIYTIKFAIV